MIFVASLGYFPNCDAALWALHDIWPRIRKRCPQAALRLVGRNADPLLRRMARQPGVQLLDGVSDVGKLYRTCALALAPVRAGGGTRIKIVEAGAYALPCVSTTIGAEGLGASRSAGVALADRADGFADACVERLRSPALRHSEGQRLRRFVQRHHDRGVVTAQLVRLVSTLC